MALSTLATGQQKTQRKLYPWKSNSGLIGFSDHNNNVKIEPQFENASLFTNEFSVVVKNGKTGVVNQDNVRIIDCQYDQIELIAIGEETLAVTKKTYNAWWKISKWKLFPGFSILGGNGDKRWFGTEVPRSDWKVISLRSRQTISHAQGRPDVYPYPLSNIRMVGSNRMQINRNLYEMGNGKIRQFAENIAAVLPDKGFLQQRGNSYYMLDQHLKAHKGLHFEVPAQVTVQAGGHSQGIPLQRMEHGIPVKLDFIENQQGDVYIFPDVHKTFPKHIAAYPDTDNPAGAILSKAVTITSIPDSPYFIIMGNDRTFYILHQDGSWENDRTKVGDFRVSSNGGKLMFPPPEETGIYEAVPSTFNVERVEGIRVNPSWFLVIGRYGDDTDTRSGIFDIKRQEWVLHVDYPSLQELSGYPNIWRFRLQEEQDYRKRKFGLIDVTTRNIIVDPQYNSLDASAKAGIYDGAKWEYFYINPTNGTAYKQ